MEFKRDIFDVVVGNAIRGKRVEMGLSQKKLAQMIGVSFQQIQNNESGQNAISFKKLIEVSVILKSDFTRFGRLVFLNKIKSKDLFFLQLFKRHR